MGSRCLFTRQRALKMGYFYCLHRKYENFRGSQTTPPHMAGDTEGSPGWLGLALKGNPLFKVTAQAKNLFE